MALPSIFQIPKPRSFFRYVSLRTAAEFITFTFFTNKITGFYGFLAIFTGFHLNALQLSNYIYCTIALVLGIYLSSGIRNPRQPIKIIALAWLYILDTVINTTYTILFASGWFLLLAQHLNDAITSGGAALGKGTMADTAGFTDPEVPGASKVEVVATPAKGLLTGQDAVAYVPPVSGAAAAGPASFGALLAEPNNLTTLILLGIFGICRIYFCLVILSYARSILRGYVASTSANSGEYSSGGDSTLAENPFRVGGPDASRLGRLLTAMPTRGYWLGRDSSSAFSYAPVGGSHVEWERMTGEKFEAAAKKDLKVAIPPASQDVAPDMVLAPSAGGPDERIRRARSGTGPPPRMSVDAFNAAAGISGSKAQ